MEMQKVNHSPGDGGPANYGPGVVPPGNYGPGTYGPGVVGPGAYGPGVVGPGPYGPGVVGQVAYGPGSYGPGAYGPGSYGPGTYGPGNGGPGKLAQGNYGQGNSGQRPFIPGSFQVGLFECYSCTGYCVSFCVPCGPCCLQAIAVDKATQSGFMGPYCLGYWCLCCGFALNRTKIREKYGIMGSGCRDCFLSWKYGHFTTWQEYDDATIRELQNASRIT